MDYGRWIIPFFLQFIFDRLFLHLASPLGIVGAAILVLLISFWEVHHEVPSHYSVLRVSHAATKTEIQSAYRKLSVSIHPDRNKSPQAVGAFQQLSKANEVLLNPEKRRLYDQFGHAENRAVLFPVACLRYLAFLLVCWLSVRRHQCSETRQILYCLIGVAFAAEMLLRTQPLTEFDGWLDKFLLPFQQVHFVRNALSLSLHAVNAYHVSMWRSVPTIAHHCHLKQLMKLTAVQTLMLQSAVLKHVKRWINLPPAPPAFEDDKINEAPSPPAFEPLTEPRANLLNSGISLRHCMSEVPGGWDTDSESDKQNSPRRQSAEATPVRGIPSQPLRGDLSDVPSPTTGLSPMPPKTDEAAAVEAAVQVARSWVQSEKPTMLRFLTSPCVLTLAANVVVRHIYD